MEKKNKFMSRKFLLCLGAALGSAGTTIGGLCIENEIVTIIGAALMAVSAGIYAFCEAWVDKAAVGANTQIVPELTDEEIDAQII